MTKVQTPSVSLVAGDKLDESLRVSRRKSSNADMSASTTSVNDDSGLQTTGAELQSRTHTCALNVQYAAAGRPKATWVHRRQMTKIMIQVFKRQVRWRGEGAHVYTRA
jgi:hypothetical protein